MMNTPTLQKLNPDATIREIISVNKHAGQLLASIGLSAEDHQNETLRSVCQQRQWSEVEVLKWLRKNEQLLQGAGEDNAKGNQKDFSDNLDEWCSYMENHYLDKTSILLNEIDKKFLRVYQVHATQYPWLSDISWYMDSLQEKLDYYLKFLQERFYPLLRELESSEQELLDGSRSSIVNGLSIVREDQEKILGVIVDIRQKGNRLESPEGSCSTLRIFNRDLKELFKTVEKQIEIYRNNILPIVEQKMKRNNYK